MDPVTVTMIIVAVAQMVTSAIASEKAAKADALEKQAIFDMLTGIATELRGVSEQIDEILIRVHELPKHIQKTINNFGHAEYRARIIGAYEDFIDEQKGLLARDDWHNDPIVISAYRDRVKDIYFLRLEPARSELRNFPRLDSVIPILTMALALKADLEMSNELRALDVEMNIVPDLERYQEYFEKRIVELKSELGVVEGHLSKYYDESDETYPTRLELMLSENLHGNYYDVTATKKTKNPDIEEPGGPAGPSHNVTYTYDTYQMSNYSLDMGGALHKIVKVKKNGKITNPKHSWGRRNTDIAAIEQFNRGTKRDALVYDAVARRATQLACEQSIKVIETALLIESEFTKSAETYDV